MCVKICGTLTLRLHILCKIGRYLTCHQPLIPLVLEVVFSQIDVYQLIKDFCLSGMSPGLRVTG